MMTRAASDLHYICIYYTLNIPVAKIHLGHQQHIEGSSIGALFASNNGFAVWHTSLNKTCMLVNMVSRHWDEHIDPAPS